MMNSNSPLRRLLKVTGQWTAIALIALALTEIAFRVVHAIHPIFIFPTASYNRFRMPPHSPSFDFTLNSGGFKDVEYPREKPAGSFRIVALGDSFAYGVVPYEHNFLTLLEEDLNRAGAPGGSSRIEVINLGIPGINTADYQALLIDEGLSYEPDLVLLNFYIGNDLRVGKGRRDPPSFVWAFLRYLLQIQPEFEGTAQQIRSYDDGKATFTPEAYRRLLARKTLQFRIVKPTFLRAFPKLTRTLAEMNETCASHGARLYMVLIPDEVQVVPRVRNELFASMPMRRMKNFDFALPNRMLHAELESLGIPHLDLLPAFRAEQKETVLYRPRDTHWNIAGNRLAARKIAAALRAGGWLPEG